MSAIYNNFGIQVTPVADISLSYNNFGVVNSNIGKTSLVPNTVVDSVSPNALTSGTLKGDIQSTNFITGETGWRIKADGHAEFQSIAIGLDLTGSTLIGSTIKTVASLPITGSGIVIDGSTGFITFYESDNPVGGLNGTGVFVCDAFGTSSASFGGLTANEAQITIAGSGNTYAFNSSYFAGYDGEDLGSTSLPWNTLWCSTIGDASHKVALHGTVTACPLPLTTNALVQLDSIKQGKLAPGVGHFGDDVEYVDVPDAPDAMKIVQKDGTKDIELTKTIGFLYSCIKELKAEVDELKKHRQINENVV